ncbi:MAG: DUF502 domain-containing protein [Candidatus Marinimicrobia bacterium]|nr:DUF502 domain-containing protein [Candidatus Neomarinimicrobiota bacterium]
MGKIYKKIKTSIRNRLLTGILTLIPVVITIYVVRVFVTGFNGIVSPVINPFIRQIIGTEIPGLALIVAIILIYLLGLFTTNYIGRKLIAKLEQWLNYIPLVRTVYGTVKKIVSTFSFSSEDFEKVVFFEHPRKGVWSMEFVTGETKGSDGTMYYNIFLPTTPNPTSGWMVFIPKADVIPANMNVEEGLKTLISAGSMGPESKPIKNS